MAKTPRMHTRMREATKTIQAATDRMLGVAQASRLVGSPAVPHDYWPSKSSGSSGSRYSLTRLVVQVATPVPKKSASSVHTGQPSSSAQAKAGPSSGSRSPIRASAACSSGC